MIDLSHTDAVTTILLNRPDKRNAMTPSMLRQLADTVLASHARTRAIVVAGAGESFCAGFDLSLCRDDEHALASLLTTLYDAIAALRAADCPVVVAAHGAAIAGGCALLGGADFVVTNADAKLGYPVVRLGISPAVTAPFLRGTVGDARTRAMLLEGTLISGSHATRIGLASECVALPADVIPRAMQIAHELAAKPAPAIRATRAWLTELDRTGGEDAPSTRAGLETSLRLIQNDESKARLAKLLDKR